MRCAPPVLAVPGQPAALAEVTADPLKGAGSIRPRRAVSVLLPFGAMLALYTDGLVERRDILLDDSLAALCTAVTPGPAETACAALMSAMAPYSSRTDDIALLLLHRADR
jgi:sigma-B regulation protein RsbU (phosphoserine phosphatase)